MIAAIYARKSTDQNIADEESPSRVRLPRRTHVSERLAVHAVLVPRHVPVAEAGALEIAHVDDDGRRQRPVDRRDPLLGAGDGDPAPGDSWVSGYGGAPGRDRRC